MRMLKLTALALALTAPAMANAARMFHLTFTTTVDATSGPAVTLDAIVTTDDGDFYGAPGYRVTGISGTRGSETLSFDPSNFGDEIFYPGNADNYYVDNFGLDIVGSSGTIYTFAHQSGLFAYQEFGGGVARILANVSLAPVSAVPEPATWAFMISGFGLAGGAMRRRTAIAVAA